jgi:chromosome transmission fidelity protein 1
MPYNMLLHDELRSSMGIVLSNSVVIFDEAHNLVEAVNRIYSADVSYDQLKLAELGVKEYAKRYQAILTGKNYYYVNILISVISGLKQSLSSDRQQNTVTAYAKYASQTVESRKKQNTNICDSGIVNNNKNRESPDGLLPTDNVASAVNETVPTVEISGINDFIFFSSLDNINLFKLRRHMTETNLVNKVGGYADYLEKNKAAAAVSAAEDLLKTSVSIRAKGQKGKLTFHATSDKLCGNSCKDNQKSSSSSQNNFEEFQAPGSYMQALRNVLTLITCLTNADVDGRVVISKYAIDASQQKVSPQQQYAASSASTPLPASHSSITSSSATSSSIKFILLNPSAHFQKIVDQARSVLLIGGTLQPFSYVKSFLFPRVPSEKLSLFACGHVVDKANVMTLVVSSSPNGGQLELTHSNRMLQSTLIDLQASIKQISSMVPNGIVVFFSSYQYMAGVISKWHAMGLYNELSAARPIFVEPRLAGDAINCCVHYLCLWGWVYVFYVGHIDKIMTSFPCCNLK